MCVICNRSSIQHVHLPILLITTGSNVSAQGCFSLNQQSTIKIVQITTCNSVQYTYTCTENYKCFLLWLVSVSKQNYYTTWITLRHVIKNTNNIDTMRSNVSAQGGEMLFTASAMYTSSRSETISSRYFGCFSFLVSFLTSVCLSSFKHFLARFISLLNTSV